MPRISEVVKHLLIINVLVYFGSMFLLSSPVATLAMHWPESPYFKPFQLVSHMFMHASPMHLFFNMFGLYMFGSSLEYFWGPKRFLSYYLICGFGALGIHLLYMYFMQSYIPVVGASGAIYGLLLGFGLQFPNMRIMLLIPPIPMKAKYFVLIFAAIELYLGFSGRQTNVAHFAHLGGALTGILIILYWKASGSFNKID